MTGDAYLPWTPPQPVDDRMTKDQAHQILKLLIRINTTLDLIAHQLEQLHAETR